MKKRGLKWLAMPLVLCLLALLPAATAEEEFFAAPVEEMIGEVEADLWTEEASDASAETVEALNAGINAVGDVPVDEAHFPDARFRKYVTKFDTDSNGSLSKSERDAVTKISVGGKGIVTLLGIEYFPALNQLNCRSNQLESLDARNCPLLETLDCSSNERLVSLNVHGCTALKKLDCSCSWLENLDISGCKALTELSCQETSLRGLDISECPALKKLNCSNCRLLDLNVHGCTALTELICEETSLTSLNVSGCIMLKTLVCSYSNLIDLNVSGCTALQSLECCDNRLTHLDIHGCKKLTVLNCDSNRLVSLDISECSALVNLSCDQNRLTELDISGHKKIKELSCYHNEMRHLYAGNCPALTDIACTFNQLTVLDVNGCSALEKLQCTGNQLKKLSVVGCLALERLYCDENQLTSLDVSDCAVLDLINCGKNKLTSLDISGCVGLGILGCENNKLTSLDISDCAELYILACYNNKLASLDVSDCPRMVLCARQTPENRGRHLIFKYEGDVLETDPDIALIADGVALYGTLIEPTTIPIDNSSITVKNQTYTGSAIKPNPVVKLNGVKLVKDTDYTLSYKNNTKIGLATVTIKGKGDYTGTVNKTFKINPKKVALSKLTAGKKQLTVQWKKGAGNITGYEIQYSLKKNMASAKTVTVKKAATVKTTIKKLKTGKTYYVRVRAYAKVSGKKYVSAWSKVLKKKVK